MRKMLFVSSVLGVALLGLAGIRQALRLPFRSLQVTRIARSTGCPVDAQRLLPTVSGIATELLTGGSFLGLPFRHQRNGWLAAAGRSAPLTHRLRPGYRYAMLVLVAPERHGKDDHAKATTITPGKTVSQLHLRGSGTVLLSGGYLSEVTKRPGPRVQPLMGQRQRWKVTGVNNTSASTHFRLSELLSGGQSPKLSTRRL